MRDYLEIIKRNFLSPVVIAILLLAAALVLVHEYRDAWFISVVIIVNSLIGVVQELRAKRALRKLELISRPRAKVVRGDLVVEVDYDQLVLGDQLELFAGDEVSADVELTVSNGLEVDESVLTGESLAVARTVEEVVYAGTTIAAGGGRGRVIAVGDETKVGKIGSTLKRYQPELTPVQRAIQKAISWLTFGAIGLSLMILVVYYFSGEDAVKILKTITSAAITIIPEGLLLASSLLLAYGSLKLAQAKVLPQKLSAIEAMALLDMLCVDKTGTLTSDEISLDRLEAFDYDSAELAQLAAIVAREASGNNATGQAISSGIEVNSDYQVVEVLAFSSLRKLSAVRLDIADARKTIFMGAPEFISKLIATNRSHQAEVDDWASKGQRVLLVASCEDSETPLKDIRHSRGRVLGAVILTNQLRTGVKKSIEYFQKKGVTIRVISGDNPKTVQFIAEQAGIVGHDKVITGESLAGLSPSAFRRAADESVIFSRISPEQKERLIKHFRGQKYFTGMVGDGVNDALALKQADLGVAMHSGAAVSRRVSDIILLNNSFNSLPLGMRLGNRILQAIEIIATLFFHKIIYGVLLLLITMLIGLSYPFAPRHVTFMNIFLVTLPTIMWTLFPPMPRHRVNPSRFWQETLWVVAPIALATSVAVAYTYWSMSAIYYDRPLHVATMTVLTATFFGVFMVFLVDKIFNISPTKRTKFARLLYLGAVIFVAMTSFSIGFLRDFFDFSLPTVWILWPSIIIIALVALWQWKFAGQAGKRLAKLSKLGSTE